MVAKNAQDSHAGTRESIPKLVTIETLCTHLDISRTKCFELNLPRVRFGRRCVRYSLEEVDAFIEKQRINRGGGSK